MKILSMVVFIATSLVMFDGRIHETLAGPCNPNVQTC